MTNEEDNQPQKRHTVTHDRYTVSDGICGLVCTRTSLKKALESAKAHKTLHHESPLMAVEVFDVMARRDCAQLWNHDGEIIGFNKSHENPSPEMPPNSGNAAASPKILIIDGMARASLRGKLKRLAIDPDYDWDDISNKFERHAIGAMADFDAALNILRQLVEWERDYRTRNNLGDIQPHPFAQAAQIIEEAL